MFPSGNAFSSRCLQLLTFLEAEELKAQFFLFTALLQKTEKSMSLVDYSIIYWTK